jgi:hypothetical protein
MGLDVGTKVHLSWGAVASTCGGLTALASRRSAAIATSIPLSP